MGSVQTVKLSKKVERRSFAQIEEVLGMPNLIEVQKKSYEWFLKDGLREVFRDVASITDYSGNLVLDFLDYSMSGEPKYTVEECKERDATYAKPIKVRVRLLKDLGWNHGCRVTFQKVT